MSPTSASFFVIFLGKKWLVPNKSDESMTRLRRVSSISENNKDKQTPLPLQETSLQHMMGICNN